MPSSLPFITSETICASAPGKVILFGEHAVVYGHAAIAAALSDLRIFVCLTPLRNAMDKSIHILLPDLATPVDYSTTSRALIQAPAWPVPPQPNVTAADICQHVVVGLTDESSQAAVTPIFYLMKTILTEQQLQAHGWHIYVSSRNLPVGAGLGSSAAFSVALAAALLRYGSRDKTPDLNIVNRYAYYAEILLHGHPSGLDNAVATYGGALQFHKTEEDVAQKIHLQPLQHFPAVSLLLVHTHVPRSTKRQVAHVRAWYDAYPSIVQPILQAMGEIAQAFADAAKINDGTSALQLLLLDYVRFNHALLRAVGVSHPALEKLVQVVDEATAGAAAAKLTGAGGGGCALVVGDTSAARRAIQRALPAYMCFTSTAGGPGVQWHDNAAAVLPQSMPPQKSWTFVVAASTLVAALAVVTVVVVRKK